MNVASLELCKELYELSGWKEMPVFVYEDEETLTLYGMGDTPAICPAYDLGYLLRKLPPATKIYIGESSKSSFALGIFDGKEKAAVEKTPEDAACKLAIELIKQGVLKP